MPAPKTDSMNHPVRAALDRLGILSVIAARACGCSPSAFSSKLAGRIRWTTDEASALLALTKAFDPSLRYEDLFPLELSGVRPAVIDRAAREATKARLMKQAREERRFARKTA